MSLPKIKGTTILAVRRDDSVVMGGDGQATMGESMVVKDNITKVRRLCHDKVIAGFAGSTADAFTLAERFEGKLEQYRGNLERAAVELARDWRTDKALRRLEAMLLVADEEKTLMVSVPPDVMSPGKDGVMSIGSGSAYAKSAALALVDNTKLSAKDIVKKSLNIAADICVFTNHNLVIESIDIKTPKKSAKAKK